MMRGIIKTPAKHLSIIAISSALLLGSCGDKSEVPQTETDSAETSHHIDEGDSPHTHETQNKKTIIAPETGEYKPFDRDDRSTWGTVVETTPDGIPSRYFKILPDGNYMTIIFSHALDTLAYSQRPENVDVSAPDGSIGSEYLHWNRPDPLKPIFVQDATSKPGWDRAVSKATRNWNRSTRFNIQYQKVSIGGVLGGNCEGFKDGVIRVCNLAMPASHKGDGEAGRMDGGYAQIRSSPKGHISAANVYLNDINYYTLDENVDHVDHANEARHYLACHEIGHALGLGHDLYESFRVSCMAFISLKRRPSANLKPSLHDVKELERVSSHSHEEGQSLGVFCKEETDKKIRTYYLQRVSYNGVKAFAQTEIDVFKVNPKTQNARKVRFDTEDGELVEIRWSASNKNDMKKHTDGREGEFPGLVSDEMRAKVTQRSKYKSVEKKLSTALRDGEVKGGAFGCTKLTEEQAKDVSRFRPPKNGQVSGSYRRFQKTEDLDGSRIDAPDVEMIYRYVAIEGVSQIIDDPVIKPFTPHEPAAR